MPFFVGTASLRLGRLLALSGAIGSISCEALWGPFGRDNPANCVASSVGCGIDEVCDAMSQTCVSGLRLETISPALASGRGGTLMTLRGQRFVDGARVFVDEQPASDVVVQSPQELRFTLPPNLRDAWRVPVAVQNPSLYRSERRDLFAYYAETLQFASSSVAVGGVPIGAAAGDWNGDQKLDLALITIPSSGVQILLGDGQGTFRTGNSLAVGGATMTTQHILSFDSNRDGKADLLVAAGGSLTLFLGDGQAGFATRRTLYTATAGHNLRALAVGDYDGDANPDIALTDALAADVSADVLLLLNAGNDSYAAPVTVDTGAVARSLAIADFTGDGRSDLLVGISDTRLSLWRNDGGQARTQIDIPLSGCSGSAVAPADLDSDGRIDLVLLCDATVRPLINQGAGLFAPQPDLSALTPAPTLAVADLNGDGRLDVVVGRGNGAGDSQVVGFLGDGAGRFATAQEIARYTAMMLTNGHALRTGDWDGDGKTDVLAMSTAASPSCRMLLNRSR